MKKLGHEKVFVIEQRKRVGYHGFYYLILPNHAAGKLYRYTIYKIPSSPSCNPYDKIKIVGRELTLKDAREITKNFLKVSK